MSNETSTSLDGIENLNIVNKLRKIVGSWWNIQLNFTDDKGVLKGVPDGTFWNTKNPICKLITENPKTFKDCIDSASRSTLEAEEAESFLLSTCHSGFSTINVPLKIGKKYFGSIFADGFIIEETEEEQKDRLIIYLQKNFPNNSTNFEDMIEKIPVLSLKQVENLRELLEVVMDEILNLRNKISESTENINALSSSIQDQWNFENIVGKSAAMMSIFKLIAKISDSDATILITGENGTGKEGVAKSIHVNSKRKRNNFIIQNCGALNDNLLETELFGHVKGAFTNAIKDKKGLFELADGGTLFLDEIGDTSQTMQVKLLRILQEGTFVPVGGTEQKKVDVRILAATNKNLDQMVKDGTFREDLYYRLNVINLKLPPLRERKDDISLLINKFLKDYSKVNNGKLKKLTPACIYKMEKYDWPGNVRELQNEVERLCVLSGDDTNIGEELLSERIHGKDNSPENLKFISKESTLKDAIENLEKAMIKLHLEKELGNKSRAAKKLGISRASLIMKCEKYLIHTDSMKNQK